MKLLIPAIAVAVAIAGHAMPVHASADLIQESTDEIHESTEEPAEEPTEEPTEEPAEDFPDIGSESESIGEFDSGENQADEMYQKLLESLKDVNFDFSGSGSDAESLPESGEELEGVIDSEFSPFANYDTYYGSIGSTYLEYMRGYLSKLGFREHYVGARVSQYQYIFVYGEDLYYDGSSFVGSNVNVISWYTNNNGSFHSGSESSFSLSPGNYLVYSDLSDKYPSLADLSGFTLRQVLILFSIVALVCTISGMYQVRKIRKLGMH